MGGGVCCAKNKNWENKQLIQIDQPLTWIIMCSKIFKIRYKMRSILLLSLVFDVESLLAVKKKKDLEGRLQHDR